MQADRKKPVKALLPAFRHVMGKEKSIPGQVVIQITNRCNGRCPQCGMRATQSIKRSTLSVGTIKRVIDHAAANGVSALSFTGGEPLLYPKELAALIRYAGKKGIPYIRTGTNGFVFQHHDRPDFEDRVMRLAQMLSDSPIRNFWISIDSADPETHERMRGFPGVIEGIRRALPVFHRHGIYPSANLGINRNIAGRSHFPPTENRQGHLNALHSHFCTAFRAFYQFVIELGFTIVNACYPMSIPSEEREHSLKAVYSATSPDRVVNFAPDEKAVIYRALATVIPEYRSRIRIFSPLCSLYALANQHRGQAGAVYPCRGGLDFFFIDANDGDTYPCGYRGDENLGKYWDLKKNPTPGAACTRCDWECFRDPSELFGPLLGIFPFPLNPIRHLLKDPEFFRLWMSDLRYYYKCDFFDGRKPFAN